MKYIAMQLVSLFITGYFNYKVGKKWLYPRYDRELATNATRFQIFIYQARIVIRHWIAEARGQGHSGSALSCLEGDCAILNGQTSVA